jgi:hypothetical protein
VVYGYRYAINFTLIGIVISSAKINDEEYPE